MWRGDSRLLPVDEVVRRAGGRRGYNSRRRFLALARRVVLGQLVLQGGRRTQVELAAAFGVWQSTISRDLAAMHALWLQSLEAAAAARKGATHAEAQGSPSP